MRKYLPWIEVRPLDLSGKLPPHCEAMYSGIAYTFGKNVWDCGENIIKGCSGN